MLRLEGYNSGVTNNQINNTQSQVANTEANKGILIKVVLPILPLSVEEFTFVFKQIHFKAALEQFSSIAIRKIRGMTNGDN